jgi:HEAT repeat protein/cyclophilin family peptidyl-prolyl cis-trans isomerase
MSRATIRGRDGDRYPALRHGDSFLRQSKFGTFTAMRRLTLCLLVVFAFRLDAQTAKHQPLDSAAISDLATLLMLEDTRSFDQPELTRLLASAHPEVRRRAMLSVARIRDARGVGLLRTAPLDADTALAATRVFAVGQLHDTLTIPWLDSLLADSRTPPTVLAEAACALGKIKTAAARESLARFLTRAAAGMRTNDAIGEALLSIGRSTARGDIAPIVKWTASTNDDIRWRATWALFRPRDPAAVPGLLTLARDRSALVRSWAVRGLAKPQADSALAGDRAEGALIAATADADHRVRTEAVRALATYGDSAAVARLVDALDSKDSWISVSAAEGLARERAAWTIPKLLDATRSPRSCALRATAMRTLDAFATAEARTVAAEMARDSASYCRNAAAQLLRDTIPNVGRGGRRGPRPAVTIAARPMAEYRAIVERWIVPAYDGRPLPRAHWETPRGAIEIELYAGDAPLAMDALERLTNAGTIVGTEFTRVVSDFVDQQATIRDAAVQRDEVNRHRLTRGNLAWASAGLDTGRPGYTLNHTPQPHNEGDFTSLGRVVAGQDVVDRIELGDRIVSAELRR